MHTRRRPSRGGPRQALWLSPSHSTQVSRATPTRCFLRRSPSSLSRRTARHRNPPLRAPRFWNRGVFRPGQKVMAMPTSAPRSFQTGRVGRLWFATCFPLLRWLSARAVHFHSSVEAFGPMHGLSIFALAPLTGRLQLVVFPMPDAQKPRSPGRADPLAARASALAQAWIRESSRGRVQLTPQVWTRSRFPTDSGDKEFPRVSEAEIRACSTWLSH